MTDVPHRLEPPGPVGDNAVRLLATDELVTLCRWLGIDVDPRSVRLGEALPAQPQPPDLLVGTGRGRLAQVEFVRRPTPDLPLRMLAHRARIMRLAPFAGLRQHVVVLAEGTVDETVLDDEQLRFRLTTTYLRDVDPSDLLALPALAPLACLGRAEGPDARPQLLRAALEVIRHEVAEPRRDDLAGLALVLAAIHLDPETIDAARRESAMPISLDGTVAGSIIARRSEAAGHAAGRAAGELLALVRVLEHRFGPDERMRPLAEALRARFEDDALAAALDAPSLERLLTQVS